MSTPDTQEKVQAPEKPVAGEAVVSKAEKKASGEAETGKDSFYEDMVRKGRALMKAREDGIRTGTHQDFGTPTIAGDDGKAIIKGGTPSKATLTQEQLQDRMKVPAEQTGQVLDYKPQEIIKGKSFALGMDYEDKPLDTRTPV